MVDRKLKELKKERKEKDERKDRKEKKKNKTSLKDLQNILLEEAKRKIADTVPLTSSLKVIRFLIWLSLVVKLHCEPIVLHSLTSLSRM